MPLIEWVTSNSDLARAVERCGDLLGFDSEFQRTDTFYPIPALYQVSSDDTVYLIDPLGIDAWDPLRNVLTNPAKIICMHACAEDVELLRSHLHVVPNTLFDTQLANAFLRDRFSASYANTVEDWLGVELEKSETRSNWLKRPLSDEQIAYAVADVTHLPFLYKSLRSALSDLGRWAWFVEDMTRSYPSEPAAPQDHYLGVKNAWRLSDEQRTVLQHLCAWRETQAQTRDVPRNRIVRDEHLLTFSQIGELSPSQIAETLPKNVALRFADALLDAHAAGVERARVHTAPPLPARLTRAETRVVSRVRDVGRDQAMQLGMAPELLSRKRDVESAYRAFVETGEPNAWLSGWRSDFLLAAYTEVAGQARDERADGRTRGR